MFKNKIKFKKGFGTIEIILASSLLILLIFALGGSLIYSQENISMAGKRNQAVFLAEEGLEATRNIRDENFANLIDGSYGLSTITNEWSLVASPESVTGFERTITISTIDANTKLIEAKIDWTQFRQRLGQITLETYLTNWKPF